MLTEIAPAKDFQQSPISIAGALKDVGLRPARDFNKYYQSWNEWSPSLMRDIPRQYAYYVNTGNIEHIMFEFGTRDSEPFRKLKQMTEVIPNTISPVDNALLSFFSDIVAPEPAKHTLGYDLQESHMGACFEADRYFAKIASNPNEIMNAGGIITLIMHEQNPVMVMKGGFNVGEVGSTLSLVDFNFRRSKIPAGSIFYTKLEKPFGRTQDTRVNVTDLDNVKSRFKRPSIFSCPPELRKLVWSTEMNANLDENGNIILLPFEKMSIMDVSQAMTQLYKRSLI